MDVDAPAPLQQLPQIAAILHVMELRLEAKQAALAELSAADYKSRTGGGEEVGWGAWGGVLGGRGRRKSSG